MARKCQSKNPTTCPIHGMGGKQEQLNIALNSALAKNDISKAVGLRQEIDSLSDATESEQKEKVSFFGRLASRFKANEVVPEVAVTTNPVNLVEEEKSELSLKLTQDCGTCRACDPPPSDITHFSSWNSGVCESPIPMPAREVVSQVLSRHPEFFRGCTEEQLAELRGKVSAVMEDPTKTSHDSGASKAAEEVRDILWDEHSDKNNNKDTSKGGFVSAAATSDIFYSLGREKELGWVEQDAPGHNSRVAYALKSDSFYNNFQKIYTESPSSFKQRYETNKGKKK